MKDKEKKKKKSRLEGSKSHEADVQMMSTKDKMVARKKKLLEKGSGGGIIFVKDGTIRVRLVSQGADKELGLEIIQFYLGKDMGSIISPATFGEPCPFMEMYNKLKKSTDEDDQLLAKKLVPKRRFLIGGTVYVDERGKEVDNEKISRPILVPSSVYQAIIDLYLDEDDWGDMTDPEQGYDIKITRSGKGLDVNYSVTACPGKRALDPKYIKEIDLEKTIRKGMSSYDELEEKLNKFVNGADKLPF